jgi:hypothetical protein
MQSLEANTGETVLMPIHGETSAGAVNPEILTREEAATYLRCTPKYIDNQIRAVSKFKTCLPGVLFSGKFSERKNDALVQHSGLLCADLDNLNGELQNAREKLLGSPYLFAVFTSPSGGGLKAVFRVRTDGAKHRGSFRAVEQHVKELTGIQIDESCKDSARLCFVSHDPAAYHNQDAIAIEPLPEPDKPRPINNGMVDLSERQRIATELLREIDSESETSGFVVCPGKHFHTSGDNERDCKIELDNVPTVHCFHNSCRGGESC